MSIIQPLHLTAAIHISSLGTVTQAPSGITNNFGRRNGMETGVCVCVCVCVEHDMLLATVCWLAVCDVGLPKLVCRADYGQNSFEEGASNGSHILACIQLYTQQSHSPTFTPIGRQIQKVLHASRGCCGSA